ncbi:MAG: hypothetical protein R2813_05745 [Flavobacteriales bacterium]
MRFQQSFNLTSTLFVCLSCFGCTIEGPFYGGSHAIKNGTGQLIRVSFYDNGIIAEKGTIESSKTWERFSTFDGNMESPTFNQVGPVFYDSILLQDENDSVLNVYRRYGVPDHHVHHDIYSEESHILKETEPKRGSGTYGGWFQYIFEFTTADIGN